jgi:hypothetical protein
MRALRILRIHHDGLALQIRDSKANIQSMVPTSESGRHTCGTPEPGSSFSGGEVVSQLVLHSAAAASEEGIRDKHWASQFVSLHESGDAVPWMR